MLVEGDKIEETVSSLQIEGIKGRGRGLVFGAKCFCGLGTGKNDANLGIQVGIQFLSTVPYGKSVEREVILGWRRVKQGREKFFGQIVTLKIQRFRTG